MKKDINTTHPRHFFLFSSHQPKHTYTNIQLFLQNEDFEQINNNLCLFVTRDEFAISCYANGTFANGKSLCYQKKKVPFLLTSFLVFRKTIQAHLFQPKIVVVTSTVVRRKNERLTNHLIKTSKREFDGSEIKFYKSKRLNQSKVFTDPYIYLLLFQSMFTPFLFGEKDKIKYS